MKSRLGFLVAAALSCTAASPSAFADTGQVTEAAALTVAPVKPTTQTWPQTIPASGWLEPWHEATIASEASGSRITEVLVDVGSIVKKGDPLVRLNQETVLADLRKQQAAVETAKADLAKAKADGDRARQVGNSGALSDQKRTEYLNTEQTALASLQSEQAGLDSERIKLEQTTITAVDDGIINSRSASLGAVVSSGTELFRLIRQQRVEWQAEVSAPYLPQIAPGQETEIHVPGGSEITGKVRLIAPTVSSDTGRAIVYVELPKEPQPRVGLYVSGDISIGVTSAMTLPETALVFKDGINYVFSIDDKQRVHRVRVDVGRRRDQRVEITSGLKGTESVVQSGGAFLSENALVKIEEPVQ
ncbi:efflux RND transporter periplasmic adaptor subunit [Agrobacterium rhizogenes]|uniref:efflux RND transporter periplasmic adaptor subunit n=1 Tax=Rhizobium rhizogenes TaxID=359 RepID=UPI000DDFF5AA|nr:efflux RND transporter periplasmic adaptor subunit [Rhizobium rhizogenes]KAA6487820.1 efflux RND transporter periplasmic adaptor subunit [Agrobacterium sp. ICMP 7243]NTF83874.1 efflux RND transporter periplasmic adaptor subunit [Rhizobium rhizogenes]NTF89509.1 efflux RND transporter periplasmic adaptor subunit [Rhizobium rhizogenes]NTG03275.1 efflux RND transporter periplasmic adaptor subunit [Rhizobium rhizogenes]NTG16757.1 efflux RND transporter periplasmic adaptor subunit [Rhizobium rhiz